MRIITLTMAAGLGLGLHSGLGHAEALQIADCTRAERVAATVDTEDREPINRWVNVDARSTGLTLVAAVATPAFEATFGKPLLSWSADDFTTFDRAMNECIRAATAERRFDAQKQLIELRRVVKFHRGQPYDAVLRARERVAKHLEGLQALPVSATKLKVLALLARLGELDRRQAIAEVRQPIERLGGDIELPAREVAVNLHLLPQAEADAYLERIRGRRDGLAEEVIADIRETIETAPASLNGLAEIENALTGELGQVLVLLPRASVAELQQTAEMAKARAWEAVEAQISALPASAAGSRQLDALATSTAARSLGRDDDARLQQLVQARRGQIGNAAVAKAIGGLDDFPDSLAGLRDFVSYAREQRGVLGRQVMGRQRQPFENAYYEKHQARLAAVHDEFDAALAEVPASREGMTRIKALLEDIDAPARSDLYLAGMARAREIAEAMARAERRGRCAEALGSAEVDGDAAELRVLGLAGATPTLEDLLCDLALAGHRVHGYEGPGFFDDDHTVELTARDGVYRTYVLNSARVGPDTEALVGVRVTEPTRERDLDAAGWQSTLAALLPDDPAGRDARCRQLLNKPEGELSTRDRMDAMACVLGSLTN